MHDRIKSNFSYKNRTNLKVVTIIGVVISLILSFSGYVYGITSNRKNEIITKLQKILSSKEFNPALKNNGKSLTQIISDAIKNLWDWFVGLLKKQLGRIKIPGAKNSLASKGIQSGTFIIEIICIVLIIAFLAAIIFFIFKGLRKSRRMKEKDDTVLLTSLKDPETVESKALEYADKGDYRQAIRLLYISMLLRFNEDNIIKIDKSKTNKQYLIEMQINGFEKYDLVTEFTEIFNRCWYGNRNLQKEKFDYWFGNYTKLTRGAV